MFYLAKQLRGAKSEEEKEEIRGKLRMDYDLDERDWALIEQAAENR